MNDRPAAAHDEWDALAAGYALHALEPDEELAFTEHLHDCDACAASLRDHELVAAQLGSMAHDNDDVAVPEWSGSMRTAVLGADTSSPVISLTERRNRRFAARALGVAAAVTVLAGVAVVGWQATSGSPGSANRAIAACEHRAGCSVVRLHASRGADPAVILVAGDRATIVPTALKPPGADRTYVLWQVLRNGGPAAVNRFRATTGTVTTPLVSPFTDTAAFAVSLEPAGPMPARPTDVLAIGNTTA